MKKIILILGVVFTVCTLRADRIAVAQPAVKGKINAGDVEMLWSMLEVSIGGDCELITRDALSQMLVEIGLSDSGLIDPSDIAARPGDLKGVDRLLIPTIGRAGSRYVLTLMVIDASTGKADADARTQVMADDFDGIVDRLADAFDELGMGRPVRKRGVMTLLKFEDKAKGFMPDYAMEYASVALEEALLEENYRLRSSKSIDKLLAENDLDDVDIADPSTFRRLGEVLRTDYLLMPAVRRFEVVTSEVYVAASRRKVTAATGYYEGNVRIVEVSSGEVVGQIPFSIAVDFSRMGRETLEWGEKDYAMYLVEQSVPVIMTAVNRTFANE